MSKQPHVRSALKIQPARHRETLRMYQAHATGPASPSKRNPLDPPDKTDRTNDKKQQRQTSLMKNLLYRLFENSYLDRNEARDVLLNMARGQYNDSQIAAFITVFLMRNITLDELVGFREALLEMRVPGRPGPDARCNRHRRYGRRQQKHLQHFDRSLRGNRRSRISGSQARQLRSDFRERFVERHRGARRKILP